MSALARHTRCTTAGTKFVGSDADSVEAMRLAGNWRTLFDNATARDKGGASTGNTAAGFIAYRVPGVMQNGRGVHWEWTQTLWQYLYDKGKDVAKIICVWRDDPIARAVSAAAALQTGRKAAWKMSTALRLYNAMPPITIEPWLFRYFLEEWEAAAGLPATRSDTFYVTYEELVENWAERIHAIQVFLGLEPEELTTPLAKLGKTPPHTFVANWELLVESFRSTRWEQHFDRYSKELLPKYMRQIAEED